MIAGASGVRETRVVLSAQDYEATVRLLRDGLGLRVVDGWDDPGGRGLVLDAGQATIEVIDAPQAARLDDIEAAGQRSGPVRLAFLVKDVPRASTQLQDAGAQPLHEAIHTPWGHLNQRLRTHDGLHLTLFQPDDQPHALMELP